MSDVESDDDGVIRRRTLVWRKVEITELIRKIDACLERIDRYGPHSDREPNEFSIEFCAEEFLVDAE